MTSSVAGSTFPSGSPSFAALLVATDTNRQYG